MSGLYRKIYNFIRRLPNKQSIIPKIKRTDVLFHAQRAIQELSYDTFKSTKSQEITVAPSLVMPLPQDYVNYVKLTWSDSAGIEHIIYPTSKTSNPTPILKVKLVDDQGIYPLIESYDFDAHKRSNEKFKKRDFSGFDYE